MRRRSTTSPRRAFRWSAAGSTWSTAARSPCWSIATTSTSWRSDLWPASSSGKHAATVRQRDGFALAEWRHGGFEMRAVADLAPAEMKSFATAVDRAVDADR